jgi:hypothetical protein
VVQQRHAMLRKQVDIWHSRRDSSTFPRSVTVTPIADGARQIAAARVVGRAPAKSLLQTRSN